MAGSASQAARACSSACGQLLGVDERALAVGRRDGQADQRAGAAAPGAGHGQPGPQRAGRVLVQPAGQLVGPRGGHRYLEALLRRAGLARVLRRGLPDPVGQGLDQPLAQHPELERVEQLVDGVPVPGHGQHVARADVERYVLGQLGELPVAQHVAQVLAQGVAGLALDLVDPVHQRIERAELRDPPGRRLLADAGDVGQVVARIAPDGREIRVLLRRQPVFLLNGLGREPGHLADPAPGHQDRHIAGHELEHVAIAADDEHVHVLPGRLGGQRGDEVVGLVAGLRQPLDAQHVEHLEDQAELAAEVGRRLPPVRLVLDPLLVPERRLAAVEGHGHVRGPLVPQHVDEHGGEPVDRVGRLAGGGGEVLYRQREEGAVGQGVPVQQQQQIPLAAARGLARCRRSRLSGVLGRHEPNPSAAASPGRRYRSRAAARLPGFSTGRPPKLPLPNARRTSWRIGWTRTSNVR